MPSRSMDLSDIEAVALDIETTGLEPEKGDDICEIAAVLVRSGKVTDKLSSLVKPSVPISPEAFAVNQISEEMLKEAPTFSEFLPKFLDFVGSRILIIHNAPFDLAFIQKKLIELGRPPLDNTVIDTLLMARSLDGVPGQNSLGQVAQRLGILQEGAHRALEDAVVTARIFSAYAERLADAGKRFEDIPGVALSAAELVADSAAVQTSGTTDIIRRAIKDQAALDIYLGGLEIGGRRFFWVKVYPVRITADGKLVAGCPVLGREERFDVRQIVRAVVH